MYNTNTTHTQTLKHTRAHSRMHAYTDKQTKTHKHKYTFTNIHTWSGKYITPAHTHAHIYTQTNPRTDARTHTLKRTHGRSHTCTKAHTSTCTDAVSGMNLPHEYWWPEVILVKTTASFDQFVKMAGDPVNIHVDGHANSQK